MRGKIQWLVRQNASHFPQRKSAKKMLKMSFLTSLYPIFEHAGWSHGIRKSNTWFLK